MARIFVQIYFGLSWLHYLHGMCPQNGVHRRRLHTDGKAKVVAAGWGTYFIAAL